MNKPLQDYVTLREASEITGLSEHNLRYWCSKGKIKGAIKLCKTWIIPRSFIRPTCTYYPHKPKPPLNKRDFLLEINEAIKKYQAHHYTADTAKDNRE